MLIAVGLHAKHPQIACSSYKSEINPRVCKIRMWWQSVQFLIWFYSLIMLPCAFYGYEERAGQQKVRLKRESWSALQVWSQLREGCFITVSLYVSHHTFYSAALQGYKSLKNCNLRHTCTPSAEVVPPSLVVEERWANQRRSKRPKVSRSRTVCACKVWGNGGRYKDQHTVQQQVIHHIFSTHICTVALRSKRHLQGRGQGDIAMWSVLIQSNIYFHR